MTFGCQTCLRVMNDPWEGINLNETTPASPTEISLKEKLMDCIPELFLESAVASFMVCHLCIEDLLVAYKFKQKCLESQQKIQGFLHEVPDNTPVDVGIIAMHYRELELAAQGNIPNLSETIELPREPYECRWCEFSCLDKSVIKHHEILHQTKEPPYDCDLCTFSSPNTALLLDHLADHYKDEPYACAKCDFQTASSKKHRQHTWRHRKKFQCMICWSRFCRKNQLNSHMKAHEEEQKRLPYQCGLCIFKTDNIKYLRVHYINNHHTVFTCRICKLMCRTQLGLWAHMESMHKEIPEIKLNPLKASISVNTPTLMVLQQLQRWKEEEALVLPSNSTDKVPETQAVNEKPIPEPVKVNSTKPNQEKNGGAKLFLGKQIPNLPHKRKHGEETAPNLANKIKTLNEQVSASTSSGIANPILDNPVPGLKAEALMFPNTPTPVLMKDFPDLSSNSMDIKLETSNPALTTPSTNLESTVIEPDIPGPPVNRKKKTRRSRKIRIRRINKVKCGKEIITITRTEAHALGIFKIEDLYSHFRNPPRKTDCIEIETQISA